MELRPFFLLLTHPSKGSWHPKPMLSRPGPCRTSRCPSYEAFADSVVLDADSPICRVLLREHDA
jgi:hypothetical protein